MSELSQTRLPRQHRKGLKGHLLWRELATRRRSFQGGLFDLNTWIGLVFAIGAYLFALGCVAALYPGWVPADLRAEETINRIFFIGSIPFTTAAFLQWLQADRAGALPGAGGKIPRGIRNWRLHDLGWQACAYQFVGTLFFNINTYDAMHAPDNWVLEDLEIWTPNILGSILFLASGLIAARETIQARGKWHPSSVEWCIAIINFVGCVAFMIAALCAVYLPTSPPADLAALSVFFTLIGAICFFLGAVLLMLEGAFAQRLEAP